MSENTMQTQDEMRTFQEFGAQGAAAREKNQTAGEPTLTELRKQKLQAEIALLTTRRNKIMSTQNEAFINKLCEILREEFNAFEKGMERLPVKHRDIINKGLHKTFSTTMERMQQAADGGQ